MVDVADIYTYYIYILYIYIHITMLYIYIYVHAEEDPEIFGPTLMAHASDLLLWTSPGFLYFIFWVSFWGFPKIRGTILGVPIISITIFWGLPWGPPVLGNYQLGFRR